jgi:hypothetical protein
MCHSFQMSRFVLQLDAADNQEVHAAESCLAADLDERRVVEQIGHPPEILQVVASAQQRAAAELADGVERGALSGREPAHRRRGRMARFTLAELRRPG